MKKILPVCLLITIAFSSHTKLNIANVHNQAASQVEDCDCVKENDLAKLCSYTKDKIRATSASGEYTFLFEELILKMSCVDLKNDSKETIIRKVNCMWDKYKYKFACDGLGFNVPNGNILKMAINYNFDDFIYLLGDNYNVDFMFKDPADGKTFVQYLNEEIAKTSKNGLGRIRLMREIKEYILEERKYNRITKMFEVVKIMM